MDFAVSIMYNLILNKNNETFLLFSRSRCGPKGSIFGFYTAVNFSKTL